MYVGRDTTTRIMRSGPCVTCAARTHDMNRQSGERTNQWKQNPSDTKRRTRMRESSACIAYACAHACMPSHRHSPPARSCVCVESVMCGADVAETRRRASCGSGPCAMTWQASEQMESEPSVRHKARTRMRESACMCACVHAEPQTLTACKIVCLCRERDVRRRCGRDTTTRIMRNGPARVSHGGKNT